MGHHLPETIALTIKCWCDSPVYLSCSVLPLARFFTGATRATIKVKSGLVSADCRAQRHSLAILRNLIYVYNSVAIACHSRSPVNRCARSMWTSSSLILIRQEEAHQTNEQCAAYITSLQQTSKTRIYSSCLCQDGGVMFHQSIEGVTHACRISGLAHRLAEPGLCLT